MTPNSPPINYHSSIPQLPAVEQAVKDAGQTILTPLVSLDTPGKATVQVVILADPVSHAQMHGDLILFAN